MGNLLGIATLKKAESSFLVVIAANSSWDSVSIWWLSLSSMMGLCLAWSCAGLVLSALFTVNSSIEVSHCFLKILLHCNHSLPLAFTVFQPSPPSQSLNLEKRVYRYLISEWVVHNLLFSSPWPVVGLCVGHHVLQKGTSLMKFGR